MVHNLQIQQFLVMVEIMVHQYQLMNVFELIIIIIIIIIINNKMSISISIISL